MKLINIINEFELICFTENIECDSEVTGVYICDLLSNVILNAKKGDIWITVQNNLNCIAIGVMNELGCIIITENIGLEDNVIKKAKDENIILLGTNLTAYEVAKKLIKYF